MIYCTVGSFARIRTTRMIASLPWLLLLDLITRSWISDKHTKLPALCTDYADPALNAAYRILLRRSATLSRATVSPPRSRFTLSETRSDLATTLAPTHSDLLSRSQTQAQLRYCVSTARSCNPNDVCQIPVRYVTDS